MIAAIQHAHKDSGYWLSLALMGFLVAGFALMWLSERRQSRTAVLGARGRPTTVVRDGCRSKATWPPHRGGSAPYVTANQPRVLEQPQPSQFVRRGD